MDIFRLDLLILCLKKILWLNIQIQSNWQNNSIQFYVKASDYVDKILILLSATASGVSVVSFASIVGSPVGVQVKVLLYFFL